MNKKGYGSEKEIKKVAEDIWEQLKSFGGYAFPKAHSTAYTLIANATQYLKLYYPTEFFCALLGQATDDEYLKIYNISKRKYKVKYINPRINKSKETFTFYNKRIVWSFPSIKGIGEKAAIEIVKEQPYEDFKDFFNRVNKRVVNIRVIRTLITAGVFRDFGSRNDMWKEYAQLRKGTPAELHTNKEWKILRGEIMPWVKQTVKDMFPDKMGSVIDYEQFMAKSINTRVVVAGSISALRPVKSKRGPMLIFTVTDAGSTFTIVCWNERYRILKEKEIELEVGTYVKVSGTKSLSQMDEDQITLGEERSSYIKVLM
jgi:DNA polymerase III alpha subunit